MLQNMTVMLETLLRPRAGKTCSHLILTQTGISGLPVIKSQFGFVLSSLSGMNPIMTGGDRDWGRENKLSGWLQATANPDYENHRLNRQSSARFRLTQAASAQREPPDTHKCKENKLAFPTLAVDQMHKANIQNEVSDFSEKHKIQKLLWSKMYSHSLKLISGNKSCLTLQVQQNGSRLSFQIYFPPKSKNEEASTISGQSSPNVPLFIKNWGLRRLI